MDRDGVSGVCSSDEFAFVWCESSLTSDDMDSEGDRHISYGSHTHSVDVVSGLDEVVVA